MVTLAAVMAALFIENSCAAQQFGHKLLGGLGLQAGVQPDTGLYVGDQVAVYDSSKLFDQHGASVPGHFQLIGVANAVGGARDRAWKPSTAKSLNGPTLPPFGL